MYLVGLCKTGPTFCVNIEQQRCKILVYTAASALRLLENASGSNSRRRKALTLHEHVLLTLVSQTTCLLRLFLAAPGVKSSFYCTLISYIFVDQGLHKTWFKVYTSLPQGICALHCGPIFQVNGLWIQRLMSLVTFGRYSLKT